ncbi:hypothetical protein GIB67_028881, partial [Kingdonia uniflora]
MDSMKETPQMVVPRDQNPTIKMEEDSFKSRIQNLQKQNLEAFWEQQMLEISQLPADFKYDPELPIARIKKIMKAEEITSEDAPIALAKACEFFIQELTIRSWLHTKERSRGTLQSDDVANAISHEEALDFLVDVVPEGWDEQVSIELGMVQREHAAMLHNEEVFWKKKSRVKWVAAEVKHGRMKWIWCNSIPAKVQVFSWKAWKEVIPVDALIQRRIPLVSQCYCCLVGETETLNHLLVQGTVATTVWAFLGNACSARHGSVCTKRPVLLRWTFPPLGHFKLNSDGSALPSEMSEARGVIRNNLGELQLGFNIALGHGTNIAVEMFGLLHGLMHCKLQNWLPIIVEVNAQLL